LVRITGAGAGYDIGDGRKIRDPYSIAHDARRLVVAVVLDAGKKEQAHTARAITRVYDVAPVAPQ
jgi:hypothetical protein